MHEFAEKMWKERVSSPLLLLIFVNQITPNLPTECNRGVCENSYTKSDARMDNFLIYVPNEYDRTEMGKPEVYQVQTDYPQMLLNPPPVLILTTLPALPNIFSQNTQRDMYKYERPPMRLPHRPWRNHHYPARENFIKFPQQPKEIFPYDLRSYGYSGPRRNPIHKPFTHSNWAMHQPQNTRPQMSPQDFIRYSPNIEVIKAVTYALPPEITTFHPTNFADHYLLDISTGSNSNREIVEEENHKISDQQQEENIKEEDTQHLRNIDSDPSTQYYLSNTKPITFENREEKKLENVLEVEASNNEMANDYETESQIDNDLSTEQTEFKKGNEEENTLETESINVNVTEEN